MRVLTAAPVFRMVILLRELEGLSTRETAAVLGVSEDTVKARLCRAPLTLQRELSTLRTGPAVIVRRDGGGGAGAPHPA